MARRALPGGATDPVMTDQRPALRPLVMGPAIVTLAVTLLRLFGERQGWSETFFSRAPGGLGALVGIVWLVLLFGLYFGWKLAQLEYRPPRAKKAVGLCLLGFAAVAAAGLGARAVGLGPVGEVVAVSVGGAVAAVIGLRAWPELGRVLLAYALAARIPVVIVYLLAFLGNWGTHYDAVPPGWPAMGVGMKFVILGLLPQLTLWIGYTIVVGTLCGLVGALLVRKNTEIEVGREILEALKERRARRE
jgi:hypothetical protein